MIQKRIRRLLLPFRRVVPVLYAASTFFSDYSGNWVVVPKLKSMHWGEYVTVRQKWTVRAAWFPSGDNACSPCVVPWWVVSVIRSAEMVGLFDDGCSLLASVPWVV